ncbi:hypothetical protein H311_01166 [Anncaliia algerae PRA109]|nr:hypothetical protein H311_01166 [Anncaliia algerae PRA109]
MNPIENMFSKWKGLLGRSEVIKESEFLLAIHNVSMLVSARLQKFLQKYARLFAPMYSKRNYYRINRITIYLLVV